MVSVNFHYHNWASKKRKRYVLTLKTMYGVYQKAVFVKQEGPLEGYRTSSPFKYGKSGID